MTQLALLLGAAGPGRLAELDGDQALRVVEAAEVVKSWADSVCLAATAVLVVELEADFADLGVRNPTESTRIRFLRSCRSAASREIQVATGLPITQCQHRVWLAACEPERAGPVREAMRLGQVTFARAVALTEATRHLDPFTAAGIAARVLRRPTGPDGVPLAGAAPLSQATFNARLRTQLVLANGPAREAERTHEDAVKNRSFRAEPERDGTGSLRITGDGPRISAASDRVDRIARRLRNNGDCRTLAQLRADVATDLLLRGWIPDGPTFASLGRPPAAFVNVVVTLSTLLNVDGGVGQITGWGAIPAAQARGLALAAGSIWTRIVTDPLTGRAIEATAGTYRIPAGMAQQVKIRDGTCRAPGCELPASSADLDHTQEWKPDGGGGATSETNLAALHRGHHNLKTTGFWDSTQGSDGVLTWTTATGRVLTTYPYAYDHPDNLPIVAPSSLEAHLGRRLAPVDNPDIPDPAHFSIFDAIGWAYDLAPATPTAHPWPAEFADLTPTVAPATWHDQTTGPPPF